MIKNLKKNVRGFTLIELMIVVAIIGILAAIAIPNFLRYQLRAKSGEAAVNLAAIKTSEIAYYGNQDSYVAAGAAGATVASGTVTQRATFTSAGGWSALGWRPEGTVYFSYSVVTGATPTTSQDFTAAALSNLDGDTELQCWMVQVPVNGATSMSANAPAPTGCTAGTNKLTQVHKASNDGAY